jgi:protein-tyrosine phosphatase
MIAVGSELWLGNARDARDARSLFDSEITAVVDVAWDEPLAQLPRELIYCRFPLVDSGGNPQELLTLAVQTVVNLLSAGQRTLVACSAGMSRSPAVAAAALSVVAGEDPDEVLARIGEQRSLEVSLPLWEQLQSVLPSLRSGRND